MIPFSSNSSRVLADYQSRMSWKVPRWQLPWMADGGPLSFAGTCMLLSRDCHSCTWTPSLNQNMRSCPLQTREGVYCVSGHGTRGHVYSSYLVISFCSHLLNIISRVQTPITQKQHTTVHSSHAFLEFHRSSSTPLSSSLHNCTSFASHDLLTVGSPPRHCAAAHQKDALPCSG